ncbi:MAG TPA: NADH-quinone oxidoreductase subunit NuoN [Rickettsiales bacterium]|nr:NADH-quinone oxidoreductase subunit NuoN [Rickettsiales bacterium]
MVDYSSVAILGKTFNIMDLVAFSRLVPEMVVTVSAIILLIGGVYAKSRLTDRLFLFLSIFVLASILGIMVAFPSAVGTQYFFSHMIVADGFSTAVKMLLLAATLLVLLISDAWLVRDDNQRFEYPVLVLFSLLGMMLMASANNLLALYMGLELSSLPLYVLAGFSRESLKSTEAGLKYFVLGALASGMLLFGMSLVYGFAGSLDFDALAGLFKSSGSVDKGMLFGLVLVITALCFKISAAPFHMWTPDVYEGAPTPITAFFSTAPKVAAVALLVRVLVQPFGPMLHEWQQIVVFVSAASMIVGAFGALMQTNIKRLLAYSSIGHVGYALMGLAAGSEEGISSIGVYFALYVLMSVGAFACILMMQRDGKAKEAISDLAGLSSRSPRMAFALAVFMFSMAGIPPLAGFFGKLYVFLAAMHAGLVTLAVIGVLSSVVACFYYLKVVKVMYFDEPAESFDKEVPALLNLAMYICTAVTVLFFVMPSPLINQAHIAAKALFQ